MKRSSRVHIGSLISIAGRGREILLSEIEVKTSSGHTTNGSFRYQSFGKTKRGGPAAAAGFGAGAAWPPARILDRRFRVTGFCPQVCRLSRRRPQVRKRRRRGRISADGRWRPRARNPPEGDINWLAAEQSNSSLIIGDALMLKIYRRVSAGIHPEAEMGRYLTEQGFANTPQLLGDVVRIDTDGVQSTLAVALGFVRNQGDAWSWTLDHVSRAAESLAPGKPAKEMEADLLADCDAVVAAIGGRLGEMHAILARPTSDEGFAPGTATAKIAAQWAQKVQERIDKAFAWPCSPWFLGSRSRSRPRRGTFCVSRDNRGHRANVGQVWRRRANDTHPRRFSPRSDSRGQRGRLHHRFRGRTGDAVGRAPRQDKPATRCRRPLAVH